MSRSGNRTLPIEREMEAQNDNNYSKPANVGFVDSQKLKLRAMKEDFKEATNIQEFNAMHYCCCGCVSILLIILFTIPFVMVKIADTERAVAYSTLFADFEDEILESGGIKTKPFAGTVYRWPRVEETIEFKEGAYGRIFCNSKDGLQINMHVSFQYFPQPSELIYLTQRYIDYKKWSRFVRMQAESTIRHVCGDFTADDFQTNRGAIALAMEDGAQQSVAEKFRGEITKLQLRDVLRPNEYENAVKDKENARSEIQLALNERVQKVIQANTSVDIANQERIRLLNTAQTNALIKIAQANSTAEAVIDRFENLADVYSLVKTNRNLTVNGILTYISNEIFHKDITIAVSNPSRLTFDAT